MTTLQFERRNIYGIRTIDCPKEWEYVDLD